MNKSAMVSAAVFAAGLAVVGWVGWGFVGGSLLALAMTALIAAVYALGALELLQFRRATGALWQALETEGPVRADLDGWLADLPAALRQPARQRIEGVRAAWPGPALAPYLVGLLVMLGMLGTFLGMVVTFKGAVLALENSASLESIRAALAEPIKGLGLSFGTSVAGVAASAALGLLLALARRDRTAAVRLLDARIPTVFKPFSAVQRRDAMFASLQAQAEAMPLIASRLQSLMEGLERRHSELNAQLLAQQDGFHREASAAYTALATSVGAALQASLVDSARKASEAIAPVVEQAMASLAQEARHSHQELRALTTAQMDTLTQQWQGTAQEVAGTWTRALHTHAQTQDAMVVRFDGALQSVAQALEQRTGACLASLNDAVTEARTTQAHADEERLERWHTTLEGLGHRMAQEWERVGAQAAASQQGVAERMAEQLKQVTENAARLMQTQAGLAERLDGSLHAVAATVEQRSGSWMAALEASAAQSQAAQEALASRMDGALQRVVDTVDQRALTWATTMEALAAQQQAALSAADAELLERWGASMEAMARTLAGEWERAGAEAASLQQGAARRMGEEVTRTLEGAASLVAQSEALMRSRVDAEARWAEAQRERMDAVTGVWRTELQALRDAEAQRGDAAVRRLDALQAAVAEHLATLGASLEAPLTRLLQTAASVPQAAAEVIAQLRAEMTQLSERDNRALAERTAMLGQLGELLDAVGAATSQQRTAIESLVGSAASVLETAGEEFSQALGAQAGKVDEVAAHVAASAVELSSLGEAFGHGVERFAASNDRLMESLRRIEAAIGQSLGRSDEQLAYYVAQAREVIDLSIASQQGIVEDLRRLHGKAAVLEAAG